MNSTDAIVSVAATNFIYKNVRLDINTTYSLAHIVHIMWKCDLTLSLRDRKI